MHGDSFAEARSLAKILSEYLDLDSEKIPIYDLPPAILVHAGPGVLAVSFYIT